MNSAFADRSERLSETTGAASFAAARLHEDLSSVNQVNTSARKAAIYCDERVASAKTNRSCRSRASWYDATTRHNQCGTHRSRTARIGVGPSWSADRTTFIREPDAAITCETSGHTGRPASAIGRDGVARCLFCSFDYELAQPMPVLG